MPSPPNPIYAHSTSSPDRSDWETLDEHAERVAVAVETRTGAFGASAWGRALGVLHDLGKATPAFQLRLAGGPSVPHAGQGAVEARYLFNDVWQSRLLGYCIAGHHAGLPDGAERGSGGRTLADWYELTPRLPERPDWVRRTLRALERPPQPLIGRERDPFARAFFTRMVFSALVDADRQETARFYGESDVTPWSGAEESWREDTFRHFEEAHRHYMRTLASRPSADKALRRLRDTVLAAAFERAADEPGLFSMAVPTGGGKTLASLGFAIRHARAHALRRIVYVAPFTTIVEQTADVFRAALGNSGAVLEHHSNFEPAWDGANDDERQALRETELRWEHPVVVTTAVQLFESLFAASPARCRKLHRLAGSVIVLDEFQSLPLHVLRPCLRAISELSKGYGASVVLCTATQPAVRVEDGFEPREDALANVREIAPDPEALAARLARVRVVRAGIVSDDELTDAFGRCERMLAIVNNRRHAREQFERIATLDGACHLSTAMMPAHRRRVLVEVRRALATAQPCRLVATSVVEAGVDLDFPEVWRAMAGIEGMTQAAGRCNREGLLGHRGGRFVVFEPEPHEGRAPPRALARFAAAARVVLEEYKDPLSPAALRRYFEEVYWSRGSGGLDTSTIGREASTRGVLRAVADGGGGRHPDFPFAAIAQGFNLIEEGGIPVIVPDTVHPDGAPARLIEQLHRARAVEGLARDLQRHTVSVPERARAALLAVGAAHIVREDTFGARFAVLDDSEANAGRYTETTGLDWTDPIYRAAEGLII